MAAVIAGALLFTVASACGDPPASGARDASTVPGAPDRQSPEALADPVGADSARILDDLTWLAADAREGRAPGTPGSAAARGRIHDALREAGAEPFGEGYDHPFALGGSDSTQAVNVLAGLSGTDPDLPWIVLSAHYDHLGIRDGVVFNGADDNASGTAALLFMARHLAAHPLRHPVVLAAFDAEERGLRGARALVSDPPVPAGRMALNVNMDMLARGNGVLWAAGSYATPELRPVLESVAAGAPMTLRMGHDRPDAPEGDDWTHSSDHGPFNDAGIPWVYFGVEDHPDVHRATDDVENVDPSDYLDAIRTVLVAIRALDEALPLAEGVGGNGSSGGAAGGSAANASAVGGSAANASAPGDAPPGAVQEGP